MQPIRFADTDTLSLRQLDELNHTPKGTAFRGFRRCEAQLEEGKDFFYLADRGAESQRADLRHHGQSGAAEPVRLSAYDRT